MTDALTIYLIKKPDTNSIFLSSFSATSAAVHILTCPCDVGPLTPHFNIVKLVYIIFLFLLLNIDCENSVRRF